jgi:non-specific serine/threonine protein kinase
VIGARRHLVVLDNVEHLAAAARDIAWLIGLDADLRILATSRTALQIRGEREFALRPLEITGAGVDLFEARAKFVNRSFAMDEPNRVVVERIVQRLDGIPLAIELAAARMKVVSPIVLESMLDQRMDLLSSNERDRPDRHRTMRDAIQWSFDLLSGSQRDVFARTSVFEGGFTLREAIALASDQDDPAAAFRTLDLLSGLIDASLLMQEPTGDEPRFRMLETIRAFGQECLADYPDSRDIRDRHARLFLDLAEASIPAMRGADRTQWLDRLEAAHANARAGLSWFVHAGQTEYGLRMAAGLWQFWWWRSHILEGRKLLELAVGQEGAHAYPVLLARCLTGLGALTETQGRYADAETWHMRAEALLEQAGDERAQAELALFRWLVSFNAEDQAAMELWSGRSLALFRQLGDQWGVAMSLMEQGVMAMRRREHERATDLLSESIRMFDRVEDAWGVAICRGVQSNVETDRGNRDLAARLQRQSLTALLSLNDLWGVATVLPAASRLAGEAGQLELAVRISGATAALHERIGAPLKVPFRERFDATLGTARQALGAATFERVWSEGRVLTADDAVALATSMQIDERGVVGEVVPPVRLSPREREILRLVPTHSARAIGEQLFISESTVRTHIDNILSKYGARTQKELIAMMHGQSAR